MQMHVRDNWTVVAGSKVYMADLVTCLVSMGPGLGCRFRPRGGPGLLPEIALAAELLRAMNALFAKPFHSLTSTFYSLKLSCS